MKKARVEENDCMDIVLNNGERLSANKSILAARSPVFARMISPNEQTAGIIRFASYTDDVVRIAIHIIHDVWVCKVEAPHLPTSLQWAGLYEFTKTYDVDIMKVVMTSCPTEVLPVTLVELGRLYEDANVLNMAISRLCSPPLFDIENKRRLGGLVELDWDTFMYMFELWMVTSHSKYPLLFICCTYCASEKERVLACTRFERLIVRFNMLEFARAQLKAATGFPMIVASPAVRYLMGQLSDALKRDI